MSASGVCDCLFVYGTLRRSARDSKVHLFDKQARFLGLGRTRGVLYKVSWHPGMTKGDREVVGEVWRLDDPDAAFAVLDAYEGPDYTREVVAVTLDGGGVTQAWTYFYLAGVSGLELLPHGDWTAD